ncbi:DUF3307 domain-containing protein [Nitratireductor sp. GCM10026969]|uniref:DUF3307 domain-containing protein n=1 Tax=Nitratireductor sp. GCM10026969 TaxID=3252645 RepID=UPI0036226DD3
MTISALIVLVILEVKHFLFDFVFQTPYQLRNKGTYGHPGGFLHAGLHVGGTFLALLVIAPPLLLGAAILVAEFVVHYHIDWVKEYIGRRTGNGDTAFFWRMIGLDQLMHHLTYVAILVVLFM